jgi:hypothetical protein
MDLRRTKGNETRSRREGIFAVSFVRLQPCPMVLRATKVTKTRSWGRLFSPFLRLFFNRVPHGLRRATKANEGTAARGNGINNLGSSSRHLRTR